MWKCAGNRHFERILEAKRRDEVRNLVPFIGTKYIGTDLNCLDVIAQDSVGFLTSSLRFASRLRSK